MHNKFIIVTILFTDDHSEPKHRHLFSPYSNRTMQSESARSQSTKPACLIDSYPLPRVEELLTILSNGNLFSKLDMSQAYLQLPLGEESKEYVTVNTHKGLYRYNRLLLPNLKILLGRQFPCLPDFLIWLPLSPLIGVGGTVRALKILLGR